jgi:hypothetical protein
MEADAIETDLDGLEQAAPLRFAEPRGFELEAGTDAPSPIATCLMRS